MMGNKSFVFRFADIEVREREFSLIKAGEALPVELKAFRVLLILLRNPQKLITKEELLNAVWGDAAVTENSLTRSIALLRRLLGDDTHEPRYIGTVPTVGYRFLSDVEVSEETDGKIGADSTGPNGVVGADGHPGNIGSIEDKQEHRDSAVTDEKNGGATKVEFPTRKRWLIAAAVLAVGIAGTIWYLHRPLPPPQISEYTPLTHEGKRKFLVGTDGSRLYFNRNEPHSIDQLAITRGEIAPVPVALPNSWLQDVSPDGSALLVSSWDGERSSLWSVGIPGNSPRHLAEANFSSAAWSPDGRSIAYATLDGTINTIRSDGTDAHKLATPGLIDGLVWSPDDKTIRFSSDHLLWEISSGGANLHELLPGWPSSSWLCCGHWTANGDFFLFLSGDSLMRSAPALPGTRLWALDERHSLFRKPPSQPIPLTSGPTRWASPIPSRDGKKIFAGVSPSGENLSASTRSPTSFCPTWAAFPPSLYASPRTVGISPMSLFPTAFYGGPTGMELVEFN